jgi:hypothetical protein
MISTYIFKYKLKKKLLYSIGVDVSKSFLNKKKKIQVQKINYALYFINVFIKSYIENIEEKLIIILKNPYIFL